MTDVKVSCTEQAEALKCERSNSSQWDCKHVHAHISGPAGKGSAEAVPRAPRSRPKPPLQHHGAGAEVSAQGTDTSQQRMHAHSVGLSWDVTEGLPDSPAF